MSVRKRKETHCLVCDAIVDDSRPYYRRYRTCHICATAERVSLHGDPHRFCQQCGKYELLSLFEGQARTCRVALARHSERRRNATLQRKRRKMEELAAKQKRDEQDRIAANYRVTTKSPIPLRLYPEDSEEASLARKMKARLLARLTSNPVSPHSSSKLPPLPHAYHFEFPDTHPHAKMNERPSFKTSDPQSLAVERGLLALLESMGGARS